LPESLGLLFFKLIFSKGFYFSFFVNLRVDLGSQEGHFALFAS